MLRRLAFILTCVIGAPALGAGCDEDVVKLRSENTAAQFRVEVADTPEEQAKGLMFVENMPRFEGMLFVNEAPRRSTFWMKNTLISLDMLFIDETGTVSVLFENATPLSEKTIDGGPGVKAVLEINGGLAATLGLGVGTQVQHPAFEQEIAVWPCEE